MSSARWGLELVDAAGTCAWSGEWSKLLMAQLIRMTDTERNVWINQTRLQSEIAYIFNKFQVLMICL